MSTKSIRENRFCRTSLNVPTLLAHSEFEWLFPLQVNAWLVLGERVLCCTSPKTNYPGTISLQIFSLLSLSTKTERIKEGEGTVLLHVVNCTHSFWYIEIVEYALFCSCPAPSIVWIRYSLLNLVGLCYLHVAKGTKASATTRLSWPALFSAPQLTEEMTLHSVW